MTRICDCILRSLLILSFLQVGVAAQVAIKAGTLHTMAGPPLTQGVVVITAGKIAAIGEAGKVAIPDGHRVIEASVVTPGLIDAHTVVGLAGYLNQDQDQDQIDTNAPVQPELRAIDAFNAEDRLVEWLRGLGITTLHTGHAPGPLVSGQTMIVKTRQGPLRETLIRETAAVAATLGDPGSNEDKKGPTTRSRAIATLRAELIKAEEYRSKLASAAEDKKPSRDLKLEMLSRVLSREVPLLVTAHRAQDIESSLRLANEFGFRLWLDGAAEAYLLLDPLKQAGVPVFIHPPMARFVDRLANASLTTPSKLKEKGIPFAFQSGYESYVPKSRVVLFEAAIAHANGLDFESTLAALTRDAATILGIIDRVGTLEVGKDGDCALFDGNPFETTTHCVGTVIDGLVVSDAIR